MAKVMDTRVKPAYDDVSKLFIHYQSPGEGSEVCVERYNALAARYGELERALAQNLALDISCY